MLLIAEHKTTQYFLKSCFLGSISRSLVSVDLHPQRGKKSRQMQKWKYRHKDHPWQLQLRNRAATDYSCIIQPARTSQPANRRQDGRPAPSHPAVFQRRAWWVTYNQAASNVKRVIERRCCESGCLLSHKYWLLAILYTSAIDSANPPPSLPLPLNFLEWQFPSDLQRHGDWGHSITTHKSAWKHTFDGGGGGARGTAAVRATPMIK